MLKPLFKITFVTLVWKKYKQIIISTLLLFLFMWLASKIHQDYLEYSELRNNTEVGWSFIVKWLTLASGIIVYVFYHSWRTSSSSKKTNSKNQKAAADKHDPFASLRTKGRLRSKADFIIEKNNKKRKT